MIEIIFWVWLIWVLGIVLVATLLAIQAAAYYFRNGQDFTSQPTMKIVRAAVLWPLLLLLALPEKTNPFQIVAEMKDW